MAGAEKCHLLNQLRPTQWEEKREALQDLFGSLGERMMIFLPLEVQYGSNITVGDDVTFNRGITILDMAPVSFGDNVMVGPNSSFFAAGHSMDPDERRNVICTAAPITIEHDAWIGGHCVVLAGRTIGHGAVIGAGSVVTRDIPRWSSRRGIPAGSSARSGPRTACWRSRRPRRARRRREGRSEHEGSRCRDGLARGHASLPPPRKSTASSWTRAGDRGP
ncbi:sugar O-acetyltransferase [Brachybacterium sp. AOP35-5H-19]|uniref:sugar O-acetyltransferase n=1 Tax=Brachybacterium sp. AOP35-5H-19 TaxID=3457685 RepID=UPI004033652E